MRRVAGVTVLALALVVVAAAPALACGGLVGENGTIQLTRTTTLAAYRDGVERYVTTFEFSGSGAEVGSIVPLPAVPTRVERGGDWTLQRLVREVRPPVPEAFAQASGAASLSDKAEVIQQTTVDALDITILRGGGDSVGRWAIDHGFLLTPDAPAVLTADTGVQVARSEPASRLLLDDLRSDRHMGWVPDDMWFTYVNVASPAAALRHDLAVSTRPDTLPSARLAGFETHDDAGGGVPWGWFAPLAGVSLLVIVVGPRFVPWRVS